MISTPPTRPRSSSSASDDPSRKRMTHLTMRLKNAFRISQPASSFPMQTRSMSLPPISCHQRFDDLPLPTFITTSRPLSCVVERPMDAISLQEEEEDDDDEEEEEEEMMDSLPCMDTDEPSPSVPHTELAEFEYSNHDIMPTNEEQEEEEEEEDSFEYGKQTEWVDTSKHWYSDYLFPFQSKSNTVTPTDAAMMATTTTTTTTTTSPTTHTMKEGGILKDATTVLGKRHHSTPSPSPHYPLSKKKKRIPVIRFDKIVQVHSTYSHQDYNRHPDPDAICTRLNATLAHQIKQELNLFKTTEMPIHEQSKPYTQIFS